MFQVNNPDVKLSVFADITTPQEIPLLVAFFDLTGFLKISESLAADDLFNLLSNYFEFVGDIIESSGGKVVKFIGDAGLADHKVSSRNIIQAHFGPVKCGPCGTRTDKRFDIIGQTVNVAATLKSTGVAITPQVFRKLQPDTRKFFKKHTPPITYISIGDRH